MDYRYYRGERTEFSKKAQRYIHILRYVGTVMLVVGILIPLLITTRVIEARYSLNILSGIFMVLGPMLVLIGVSWNTFIDRG